MFLLFSALSLACSLLGVASDSTAPSKRPPATSRVTTKSAEPAPVSFISATELHHGVTGVPLREGQTSLKIGVLTAGFSHGLTDRLELGLTWFPPVFLYGLANAVMFQGEEAGLTKDEAERHMLLGLVPLGLHAKYALYRGDSCTASANVTLPLAEIVGTCRAPTASITVSGFGAWVPTTDYALGGVRGGAVVKMTSKVNLIVEGAVWHMGEATGVLGSGALRLGSPGGWFVDLSATGVLTRADNGHINRYFLPLVQVGSTF